MTIRLVLAALGLIGLTAASHAQDAALGAKVFTKCMTCHTADDATNKVGPTLKGVVGRKAASVAGYKYSPAMLAKGAQGVVWDEATLATYLPDPRSFAPGTKMTFPGLKNPQDVANVIAYLKTKGM